MLLKNGFSANDFDDAFFFDIFDEIVRRGTSGRLAVDFRIYVEGLRSFPLEARLSTSRPDRTMSVEAWLKSIFGDDKVCIVLNHAEGLSEALAAFTARTFLPITNGIGYDRAKMDVTLFMGNYGYTPFGIHIDDDYSSIVHFHVGPGTKTMTLIDEDVFLKASGGVPHSFDMEKMLPLGTSYTIEANDLFLLPPHFHHIGHTSAFSIGIGISIARLPDGILLKDVVGNALASSDLGELKQSAGTMTLSDWIGRAEADHLHGNMTNLGLKTRPAAVDSPPDLDRLQCRVSPLFSLLITRDDEHLLVWGRGHCIRAAYSPDLHHCLSHLGQSWFVPESMREQFESDGAFAAFKSTVTALIAVRALETRPVDGNIDQRQADPATAAS